MTRQGRRYAANGRSKSEQYVALPYVMLKSDAWRSLDGPAIKVFLELHTRYHGGNNGGLSLSFVEAKKALGLGNATISRAFKQLEQHGFITNTKRGRWYGRMAHEWCLATKSHDGAFPTNEWKQWRKTKGAPKDEHDVALHVPTQAAG